MSDSTTQAAMPPAEAAPRPRIWPMYRAVVGVGLACGFAIVMVYQATGPIIQANKIAMREEAITKVLDGATTSTAFRMKQDGSFEAVSSDTESTDADPLVFAGYDDDKKLVGLALEAKGMGYQDYVRILYGYSFEKQAVLDIYVLESRETPGLGDRIEKDKDFLSNFGSLDVTVNDDGSALKNLIEFVKPGEKTDAWQIDGISGATITSKATADMLRDNTAKWIPVVRPRKDDFQYQETPQ